MHTLPFDAKIFDAAVCGAPRQYPGNTGSLVLSITKTDIATLFSVFQQQYPSDISIHQESYICQPGLPKKPAISHLYPRRSHGPLFPPAIRK